METRWFPNRWYPGRRVFGAADLRKAIPATPLHTLESIFGDPHLRATGFFEEYDHPTEGNLLMILGPKNWSKTPPRVRRPAPLLGENTVEVLTEIGYPEEAARDIAGAHEPRPAKA